MLKKECFAICRVPVAIVHLLASSWAEFHGDLGRYLGPHGKLGYSSVRYRDTAVLANLVAGVFYRSKEEFASEAFLPVSRSLSKNLISWALGLFMEVNIFFADTCDICVFLNSVKW